MLELRTLYINRFGVSETDSRLGAISSGAFQSNVFGFHFFRETRTNTPYGSARKLIEDPLDMDSINR